MNYSSLPLAPVSMDTLINLPAKPAVWLSPNTAVFGKKNGADGVYGVGDGVVGDGVSIGGLLGEFFASVE
jgi:hypothetical protein